MIKKSIVQIAKDMFLLGNFDEYDMKTIITVLKSSDEQYFNQGQSYLTDAEYDALKQYGSQREPQHSYFLGIGAEVRGGKVKLPYTMGSLDQVYEGEITDWVGNHSLQDETVIITNKLDGISAMLIYDDIGNLQIAYSRGNGVEGADITRHVKQILNIPKSDVLPGLVVRGEIIFPIHKFEEIKDIAMNRSGNIYKNPRNAIAGIMNAESNSPVVYPAIDFIAHSVVAIHGMAHSGLDKLEQHTLLMSNLFHVAAITWNTTGKELTDETLTNSLNISRYTSAYEIDGLVIDVNHASKRRCMVPTRETLNPGYAVKYKIADASNVAVTKVVDVEFTISKNGYLKPTIHIVPTNLNGVTVTKMTGFNAKFIYENKIGPGAEIKVTRSGDVIPLCLGVVKVLQMVIDYDKKYKEWFETQLSNHGRWRWNETEVDAVLIDASEYEEVKIQQTLNFFRSLNAPLLKEGNVRTMFVLHDYSDANHAILSMLNYSEEHWLRYIGANGKKIYSGLRQILNSIPLYMLMGASPFFGRGVGARKFKQLLKGIQIYNIDNLNAITLDQIVNVDGFDLKTANKVLDGIYKFIPFYCGITEKTVIFNEVNTGGTMSGQVVVFTGYRNKQLEKIIEDEGGKVGTSVSGKTTLLTVADPNENSGKLKRAKELNIQIVSEKELKQILGV